MKTKLSWKYVIVFTLTLFFIQFIGLMATLIFNPILGFLINCIFTWQAVVLIIRKKDSNYESNN